MDKVFKFEDRTVPFKMSPVDIVIPCYNNHGQVSGLVESIFKTVYTNRYQITIVDDCSDNKGYVSEYRDVPGVLTISHPERRGYGNCLNTALTNTRQPWILYVEPGVTPTTQNWLLHMGQTLLALKDRGIKMVGPKADVGGKDELSDPRQQASREKFIQTSTSDPIMLESTHLGLFCFLCHRELFGRIGTPNPWDAHTLAKAMRGQGYGQAICGNSWVHVENV
jgi:hypothetical protein